MAENSSATQDNSEIPYETDKLVQNWARTFECGPERYYRPNTESEVISVSSFPELDISNVSQRLAANDVVDCQSGTEKQKDDSHGRRSTLP